MTIMTDYDRRQLIRMSERLDLFMKGEVSLRVLISDLEFLLGAIETLESSVRKGLRQKWEMLEEIYSVAVAMREGKIGPEEDALVRESVSTLRQRVGDLLETQ